MKDQDVQKVPVCCRNRIVRLVEGAEVIFEPCFTDNVKGRPRQPLIYLEDRGAGSIILRYLVLYFGRELLLEVKGSSDT